jgi:hypothetical protein
MTRVLFLLVSVQLVASVLCAQVEDARSMEVLRFDCVTGNLGSDLTLFRNGTLRLWEGKLGSEIMELSELDRDSLDAYLRRLQKESMANGLTPPEPIVGEWVETCRLTLDVPEGPSGAVTFGALDSLSLPLSRVVGIARELVALAHSKVHVTGLSREYEPEIGDVLLHRDGTRYRVNSFISDGTGIELQGYEQPLVLYIPIEALPQLFLAGEDPPW